MIIIFQKIKPLFYILTLISLIKPVFAIDFSQSQDAIEKRIAPVGSVLVLKQHDHDMHQSSTSTKVSLGKKIYHNNCFVCHDVGAANAPKLGDKHAWQPRIQQGLSLLIQHAIQGYKLMPPKGSCLTCTDEEITAAVRYIVSKGS